MFAPQELAFQEIKLGELDEMALSRLVEAAEAQALSPWSDDVAGYHGQQALKEEEDLVSSSVPPQFKDVLNAYKVEFERVLADMLRNTGSQTSMHPASQQEFQLSAQATQYPKRIQLSPELGLPLPQVNLHGWASPHDADKMFMRQDWLSAYQGVDHFMDFPSSKLSSGNSMKDPLRVQLPSDFEAATTRLPPRSAMPAKVELNEAGMGISSRIATMSNIYTHGRPQLA